MYIATRAGCKQSKHLQILKSPGVLCATTSTFFEEEKTLIIMKGNANAIG
jgi:hypothetical protein